MASHNVAASWSASSNPVTLIAGNSFRLACSSLLWCCSRMASRSIMRPVFVNKARLRLHGSTHLRIRRRRLCALALPLLHDCVWKPLPALESTSTSARSCVQHAGLVLSTGRSALHSLKLKLAAKSWCSIRLHQDLSLCSKVQEV
jgi:hypothetical protein